MTLKICEEMVEMVSWSFRFGVVNKGAVPSSRQNVTINLTRAMSKRFSRFLLPGFLILFGFLPVQAQTTFTVNGLGDEDDLSPGDGLCDVNTAVPGEQCSLRAAIEEANALAGGDIIEFSVNGTITVGANPAPLDVPLPAITETLSILGQTAPGYDGSPVVEIDGQLLTGTEDDGLIFSAGADFSVIRSLSVINFPDNGIFFQSVSNSGMVGNYIGVAADSSSAGNGDSGVFVEGGDGNGIGSQHEPRNVISSNGGNGVFVVSATNISIVNNYIGLDPSGASSRANSSNGVFLGNTLGNTIGGTTSEHRNVISGNNSYGIQLSNADDNTIQGNYIGANASGDAGVYNVAGMVVWNGSSGNLIGGASPGFGNLISGNGLALAGDGIRILGAGTDNTTIQGNLIGTNAFGNAALGNNVNGIYIDDGAANTLIGGTTAGAVNVISGNGEHGILIEEATTTGTEVRGNRIGVNANGNAALPNASDGINVNGPSAIIVDNLIGGNGNRGVLLQGADGSTVFSNEIGTNLDGDDLGNAADGIRMASNNNAILSNTIGFNDRGIQSEGSNNTIEDNAIGTDGFGNSLGNATSGIDLFSSASNNTVESNTIAFNGGPGIELRELAGNTPVNNDLEENVFFSNGGLGIDLGSDGRTSNDAEDPDDGPNNLQNAPDVLETEVDAGTGDVTVTYFVNSDPANTAYPIQIRFYRADADHEEGQAVLSGDVYNVSDYNGCGTPPCEKTVVFSPVEPVAADDYILLTATDIDGNTSEFSPPLGTPSPVAGWRLLTVPGADLTVQDLADLNLVQGITGSYPGADPNLYVDYEGPTRFDYTAAPSTTHGLQPGKGFFWYLYDNTDFSGSPPPEFVDIEDFSFPGDLGTEQTADVTVAFSVIPATSAGDLPAYMLGNPFRDAFELAGVSVDDGTLQTNFFAWDPLFSSYASLETTDFVAAWQGVWAEVDGGVVAPPEFTLAFSSVDPSQNPPFIGLRSDQSYAINLRLDGTLEGGRSVTDLANKIRFEPDAMIVWDRHDGSKFYPPLSTDDYALLSLEGTRQSDSYRQAVRSLPSGIDEMVTIPLTFLSPEAGAFTISAEAVNLPEGWSAMLRDLETGDETNLLEASYAFSGTAGEDWQDRFEITITPAGVVSNEDAPHALRLSNPAPNPASASTSLSLHVANAQHVTAHVYDALGRRVATVHDDALTAGEESRLEIDTSALAAGAYVIRVEGETFAETRRFTVVR